MGWYEDFQIWVENDWATNLFVGESQSDPNARRMRIWKGSENLECLRHIQKDFT